MQQFKERLCLAWAIICGKDGGIVKHAREELRIAGYYDGDKMNAMMASNVIDMARVMSTQGHSGFSAPWMLDLFGKAASYEPLSPLTGAPEEWMEVADGVHQNRRVSRVFKQEDRFEGKPYDIDAVVFEEPDGTRFTGCHSRRVVTFPYTPRTVVVKLPPEASNEEIEKLAAEAWAAA